MLGYTTNSAIVALCFFINVLSPSFCQNISNYVNCTNEENKEILFLQQNSKSASIYHCKDGVLKQKGCYIDKTKKCVTLEAFKNYDEVKLVFPKFRLYDNRTDEILCDNYANNPGLEELSINEECPKDDEKKYNKFAGHPVCNIKDVHVYQFAERAWKKCDDGGKFVVQSCITNTPHKCLTKAFLIRRAYHSLDEEVIERIRNADNFCERIQDDLKLTKYSYYQYFQECKFDGPVVSTTTSVEPAISTTPDTTPGQLALFVIVPIQNILAFGKKFLGWLNSALHSVSL